MKPCKYLMDISPYPPLCDNPVRYYGGGATEARCSGCEWYEDAIAATEGRSCASCPEMDNPDSYINHIQSALKWHDEHVPRPTNPRNTCVVLMGQKPPEEVLFVHNDGGVTHYLPEDAGTCKNIGHDTFVCSECGAHVHITNVGRSYLDENGKRWYSTSNEHKFRHCPNCGKQIVEEKAE